jgi:hypothetical protein
MSKQACITTRPGATTKRELRALAKRLAASETPELRAAARSISKALAGENYSWPHHEDDYDPARCAACEPDLWVVYAIGVALADVDADDLYQLIGAYQSLPLEDFRRELEHARDEGAAPDLTREWFTLSDAHYEEVHAAMAELGYGWQKIGPRWYRVDEHDAPTDEAEAFIAELRASHALAARKFNGGRPVVADPALLHEIRFGANARKARRAQFTKGKGIDPSWLLY